MNNNRRIGAQKETLAADYLKQRGLVILERNFRNRTGEIDIIARDRPGILVFIEVKYRRSTRCGRADEAVGPSKQRVIRQTAAYYLYIHHIPEEHPVRFDVIAIQEETNPQTGEKKESIRWIRDAF